MRKKPKLELTTNQRRYIERELLRVTSIVKVARSIHVPQNLVKLVKQELIKKKKLTGNETRQSIKNKSNTFQKGSVKSAAIKTVEKQKDLRQSQSDDTEKMSTNWAKSQQKPERSISILSGKRNTKKQDLKFNTLSQVKRLKYKYKRQKLKTYKNKLKLDLKKIDMIEKEAELERREVEVKKRKEDLEKREARLERKEVDLERREVTIKRKKLEMIMKEQRIEQRDQRPEKSEQRQKIKYLDSSYIHKQKLLHDKESVRAESETYMSITDLKKRGYEFLPNKKILHNQTESVIRSRQNESNIH